MSGLHQGRGDLCEGRQCDAGLLWHGEGNGGNHRCGWMDSYWRLGLSGRERSSFHHGTQEGADCAFERKEYQSERVGADDGG